MFKAVNEDVFQFPLDDWVYALYIFVLAKNPRFINLQVSKWPETLQLTYL